MSIDAVVGANWGDEGKGRMVDYLAPLLWCVIRAVIMQATPL